MILQAEQVGICPRTQASGQGSLQDHAVVPRVSPAGCGLPPYHTHLTSPLLPPHSLSYWHLPWHHNPVCSAFYLAPFSPPSQSSSPSKAGMASPLKPPYNTSPPDPATDMQSMLVEFNAPLNFQCISSRTLLPVKPQHLGDGAGQPVSISSMKEVASASIGFSCPNQTSLIQKIFIVCPFSTRP